MGLPFGLRPASANRRWRKSVLTGKNIFSFSASRMRTRGGIAGTKTEPNRGRAATAIAPKNWSDGLLHKANRSCRRCAPKRTRLDKHQIPEPEREGKPKLQSSSRAADL